MKLLDDIDSDNNQERCKKKIEEIRRVNNKTNNTFVPSNDNIEENINIIENVFKDCDDLVKKEIKLGLNKDIRTYVIYADLMVDREILEESLIRVLIRIFFDKSQKDFNNSDEIYEYILSFGIGTADIKEENNLDSAVTSIMSGDTVLFINESKKFLIIQTRAWPNRGIQKADTEVSIKGSKESFTETLRMNTVLIRRRIRDTNLKVKQMKVGRRSKTDVAVMYIDDICRKEILREVEQRIEKIDIDAILDSSYLTEFFDKKWTIFPKTQFTERPDKAASALLEGRIVIAVDNSPYVLIVPVTLNTLFQSSDDYYQSIWIATFLRIIRYMAAFINVVLPGFYIALTTFHPSMIPTKLILAIAKTREQVPFPAFVEVILMEIMFEFLREGGIRLPQPIGSTLGIVGALIIGQAAVEASIVSPIVIIILSVTAVASFAIPNTDLGASLRIIKYFIIIMSATLGVYGMVIGLLIVLIHLVGIESFGIAYLSPFNSVLSEGGNDFKDSIVRLPITKMIKRPLYSNKEEKNRQREN